MTIIYNIFYNFAKLLARFLFSMKVIHPERMVEEGPLLIAVNHPSYFDPPLAGICSSAGRLIIWPADTLLEVALLRSLVSRYGMSSRSSGTATICPHCVKSSKKCGAATASSSFPKAPAPRMATSSLGGPASV